MIEKAVPAKIRVVERQTVGPGGRLVEDHFLVVFEQLTDDFLAATPGHRLISAEGFMPFVEEAPGSAEFRTPVVRQIESAFAEVQPEWPLVGKITNSQKNRLDRRAGQIDHGHSFTDVGKVV